MGRIKEIYVELRSRVSLDRKGMPDFGVGKCPVCNGKGCDECLHIGLVAKTEDDEYESLTDNLNNNQSQ